MGTRIRDASEVLPKPMLPIGEKPIVNRWPPARTQGLRVKAASLELLSAGN
jgi:hypothetical protein